MNCYRVSTILFCLFVYSYNALSQFVGGNSAGDASLQISNVSCAVINANSFAGGNTNVHSMASLLNIVCPVVNANPFAGGNGDGEVRAGLSVITCSVVNVNPYLGGVSDGHADLSQTNSVCAVINVNPYAGSIAGGHSSSSMLNVSPAQCLSAVLPIELLSFDAKLNSTEVDISWATASETNCDYFLIEKTINESKYEQVAVVKGAGTSTQKLNYKTTDTKPYSGISYYRLTQTDFDGSSHVSGLVAIDNEKMASKLFPNPITGEGRKLSVFCSSSCDDKLNFILKNFIGELLYSINLELKKGANEFPISIPVLANGIYYVELKSLEKSEVVKLVIK